MCRFKEVLEKKMKEKGLTMQGLSVAAGMEASAVKNIIYERSIFPKIDTVDKLARGLGCSPYELLPPECNLTKPCINSKKDNIFSCPSYSERQKYKDILGFLA